MSYQSPIRIMLDDIQSRIEDDVYNVVQSYGIEVNKEELFKALQYDREQYEKGYADAKAEEDENYPLCWEELQNMIGKPIYIYSEEKHTGEWKIIQSFEYLVDVHQHVVKFTDGEMNCKSVLERGHDRAYRKERME